MADFELRHLLIGIVGVLGLLVLASYRVVYTRYNAVRLTSEQKRVDAVLYRGFEKHDSTPYKLWQFVAVVTASSFLGAAVLLVLLDNVLALGVMVAFTASALLWSWAICNEITSPVQKPTAASLMTSNDAAGYASAADGSGEMRDQKAALADWPQAAVVVTAILSIAMLLAAAVGPHGIENETYYEWSCVLLTIVAIHHVVVDGLLWTHVKE